VGRLHQAAAEMVMPHTVDDGAPSQGIARVVDPASQGGAALALGLVFGERKTRFEWGQAGHRARTDFAHGILLAATTEQVYRPRLPSGWGKAASSRKVGTAGVDQALRRQSSNAVRQVFQVPVNTCEFPRELGTGYSFQEGLPPHLQPGQLGNLLLPGHA